VVIKVWKPVEACRQNGGMNDSRDWFNSAAKLSKKVRPPQTGASFVPIHSTVPGGNS
jgi:hypothetical protein